MTHHQARYGCDSSGAWGGVVAAMLAAMAACTPVERATPPHAVAAPLPGAAATVPRTPPASSTSNPSPAGSAAVAPASSAVPPGPCPPRPAYAPVGFVHRQVGTGGVITAHDSGGPRFVTRDPALAPGLATVQAAMDAWLKGKVHAANGACGRDCFSQASCEVTRNDGEFLALGCSHDYAMAPINPGSYRTSLVFRREGSSYVPFVLQSVARDPGSSLLLRLFDGDDGRPDRPVADERDVTDWYMSLHADAVELGVALPRSGTGRIFRSFASFADRLECDGRLDLPVGPPAAPFAKKVPLAVATQVQESGDPAVAAYWFGSETSVSRPRFIALDARRAAAASLLNEAIDAYLARVRAQAKAEQWGTVQATCRAYASTDSLVSVLCYGGGTGAQDGKTHVARGSITLRLTEPPQRIEAAEVFAARPGAPSEIARRCLGHLVRKPAYPEEALLSSLPKLSTADLSDFALLQSGVMFGVEYDLGGQHFLTPCWVPVEVLGVGVEALSRPRSP